MDRHQLRPQSIISGRHSAIYYGIYGSQRTTQQYDSRYLKDENGNIWASTNQGISFINLSSGKITNYSSRNGLQNDEFSDGAIFKDKAGWLYFGGVSGLNYFDENKIRLRDHIATLSLNSLKINNTSQNIYERIFNHTLRLDYDEPTLH